MTHPEMHIRNDARTRQPTPTHDTIYDQEYSPVVFGLFNPSTQAFSLFMKIVGKSACDDRLNA